MIAFVRQHRLKQAEQQLLDAEVDCASVTTVAVDSGCGHQSLEALDPFVDSPAADAEAPSRGRAALPCFGHSGYQLESTERCPARVLVGVPKAPLGKGSVSTINFPGGDRMDNLLEPYH